MTTVAVPLGGVDEGVVGDGDGVHPEQEHTRPRQLDKAFRGTVSRGFRLLFICLNLRLGRHRVRVVNDHRDTVSTNVVNDHARTHVLLKSFFLIWSRVGFFTIKIVNNAVTLSL